MTNHLHLRRRKLFREALLSVLFVCGLASPSLAQRNSSLLQDSGPELLQPMNARAASAGAMVTPESGMVLTPGAPVSPQLAGTSWIYNPPSSARVLRVHDVISIRVDEIARMAAEGRANQRKNALYDVVLKEWLTLDGWNSVRKARQTGGDPQVSGQLNETFRANSDVQTRESLTFNIAAEVADIKPNGNIVLEAHKTITINDNRWELSLSGVCQAKDISPDNVVMSKDILHLNIDKHEEGQSRDGYRRGWFTEWFSRLQPF